ncbi:MAG: peptidyl-prolyl cis-trans isomerase [Spirochaetales bacterium]
MKHLFALALLIVSSIVSAQVLDRPVAVVRLTETENIGRRELDLQIQVFEQQLGRELTTEEKQEVLDAMVNDKLLLQAASQDGVRVGQGDVQNYIAAQRAQFSQALGTQLTEEQFRAQVQQQSGMTWQEYVQNVSDELSKLQYVQQREAGLFAQEGNVSESDIRAFYEENATSFTNPAMVRFDHIYIDLRGKSETERQEARTTLDTLYRRIRSGATNYQQVFDNSVDNSSYSADDFGYLLRNDPRGSQLLGRPFVDRVFSLEEGSIAGVMESAVALHIVRIRDSRLPRILELGDPILPGQNVTVEQQIRNLLLQQRQQQALGRAVESVVTGLRDEAEIRIFSDNVPW